MPDLVTCVALLLVIGIAVGAFMLFFDRWWL